MTCISGKISPDVITYLQGRRSCSLSQMGDTAPSDDEIKAMIEIASRVPDHGRLFPWYFVVFKGEARAQAGDILKEAYLEEEPEASAAKLALEAERFLRAPLVIMVVSRLRPTKKTIWEQILSSGAACYNLCLAANAMGYGTNWLSEWMSYNDTFKQKIGLAPGEHIAGMIYIGNAMEQPEERPRPAQNEIVTYWTPDAALQRGTTYDPEKPVPYVKGFTFPDEVV